MVGMPKHAKFLCRTVLVSSGDATKAGKLLSHIMGQEKIFTQFRRTRYFEKPCLARRRVNYEKCKAIYNEDLDRKVKLLMRANREDPYPGCS